MVSRGEAIWPDRRVITGSPGNLPNQDHRQEILHYSQSGWVLRDHQSLSSWAKRVKNCWMKMD